MMVARPSAGNSYISNRKAVMASTIWKGYITFGLISIPVRLFAAARTDRISFNMLHEVCSTRIKQQLYCPTLRSRRRAVRDREGL